MKNKNTAINIFLLFLLIIFMSGSALAGELVFVIKDDSQKDNFKINWEDLLTERGFQKEESASYLTGDLFTKAAEKDTFILLVSQIVNTNNGDIIVLEAVDIEKDTTIYFDTAPTKHMFVIEENIQTWIDGAIEKIIKTALSVYKGCAPVVIQLKGTQYLEGELKTFFIQFKKKIVDHPNISYWQ